MISSPAYRAIEATPAEVISRLRVLCSARDHHFWPDTVALNDEQLFRTSVISGHQQITDVYLLGLAVHNHGRLATVDRSIPLRAVIDAHPRNLALIE